ncbi:MAG: hypothetical protein WCH39_00780 [Schlesneria sp.]
MNPQVGKVTTLTYWVGIILMATSSQVVNATGTKVTTVSVPSGGQAMSAKIDAKGVIHLVCDSSDGPQYFRSSDNGANFSAPMPLLDQASRKPGLEFITWDMAVTPEGAVHVVLGNNAWKLKLPKDEWGFFYTRRLPDETAFSSLKNINHKPSEGFSLAVSDTGTVTAVWMADKLYANVSHDGGTTFSSAVEIDPTLNPCNCCTTSSVYGADGKLAILYREETDNNRDMYLALWDQKPNQVTKTRVSTTPWKIDSCPMTYYSVVRSGNGYLAAWPTKGEIYFAKLDSNGSPTTPKEIKTPGSSGMRSGVIPIAAPGGQTLVAWKKENQLGWQLYDERGRPTGVPGSTKSAGTGVAGIVSKEGELILLK